MLFSAVVEKNYEEMVHTICETGCIQEVVVTEIHGSRIVPAEELAEAAQKYCPQVHAEKDIAKAVQAAIQKAGEKDGVVLAFGSLSFLGEIRKAVKHTQE